MIVAFLSASQDIVIDAYRIELLKPEEQGAGAAATQWGYRFGMIASSAPARSTPPSSAAGHSPTRIMAALMLVGMVTVWLTPEPAGSARRWRRCPARRRASGPWRWIKQRRRRAVRRFHDAAGLGSAILVFVVLYKFGDALAGVMANPFYVAMGFTKIEVANISKMFGVAATLAGLAVGGIMVRAHGHVPRAVRVRHSADAVEPHVCDRRRGRARRVRC